MSTTLSDALSHLLENWKSTVQSLLTVVIALGTYLAITPSTVISQHAAGIITLMTGAAKVLLGLIEKDAK